MIAVLLLGWWWTGRDGTAETSRPQEPTAAPSGDDASSKPKPRKRKKPDLTFSTPSPTVTAPSGLPELPDVDLPGLPGGSLAGDVPPLELRISLSSASPIGTVGWVIPTSRSDPDGRADDVGRSWSLTTTVYGRPDYARVFLQAGPTGDPITCVISVDGKVTERTATVGPYGALMCQG